MCRDCDIKANQIVDGHLCPFFRNRRPSGRRDYLVKVKFLAKKGNANAAVTLSDAYRNGMEWRLAVKRR